jgi:hypothetical protein
MSPQQTHAPQPMVPALRALYEPLAPHAYAFMRFCVGATIGMRQDGNWRQYPTSAKRALASKFHQMPVLFPPTRLLFIAVDLGEIRFPQRVRSIV